MSELTDEAQPKVQELLASARKEALRGRHGAAWEDLHGAYALGSPEAAYAIATWYLHGEHVEADWTLAVQFLEEAAAAEWPEALWDLAVCYEEGQSKPKDLETALDLYQRAALAGDREAWFEVARLTEVVRPSEAGRREAFRWYQKAAETGDAEAQYAVGWAYEYGHGNGQKLARCDRVVSPGRRTRSRRCFGSLARSRSDTLMARATKKASRASSLVVASTQRNQSFRSIRKP